MDRQLWGNLLGSHEVFCFEFVILVSVYDVEEGHVCTMTHVGGQRTTI